MKIVKLGPQILGARPRLERVIRGISPHKEYIIGRYLSGDIPLDSARTLFFKDYPQPQRCPICGGDVVPIYFGFGDTHRDFVYDSEGRHDVFGEGV